MFASGSATPRRDRAMTPLSAAEFQRLTGVSRETLDRLTVYLDLLVKWQARINLVGKGTLGDPWRRHFLDSAQIWPLLPEKTEILVDLGSGAGFPGLVLAILGVPDVHLVESDQRKAAFLREAARATATDVTVHPTRIESMDVIPAQVVTARALAPLVELIGLAAPFLRQGAVGIFPKGRSADRELTAARRKWKMRVTARQSRSDPAGTILVIEDFDGHGTSPA